jgi:HEAT repeat protein
MTTAVKSGSSLFWLPTITAVLICALGSAAQSKGSAAPKIQFAGTIARIRTGETSTIRVNNARNLADFTRSIDPKKVNDATLREIVSLLNTDNDVGVLAWVAGALGNLGPRARIAVPMLLDLLRRADCVEGDLRSAGAVRIALTRIGEAPPPEPECTFKRK